MVLAELAVFVLRKVRKRPLPPKRPSMVTLSAPLSVMRPWPTVPEIVRIVALSGWMVTV